MKGFLSFLFLFFLFPPLFGQTLVSADSVDHYTESDIDAMVLNANNAVTVYRLTYRTPDLNGNMDTASGAVLVPDVNDCPEGYPLVSYQHGTVTHDLNVPSANGTHLAGLNFAGDGYVVSMPDYLGLGQNEGLHPYHHANSEASASLDMLRASREFMETHSSLTLNEEVFLTGYSQGGHSTMALHRHIETNGLLDTFDVRISAPMSGAYDLSGVQSRLPSDSSYKSPAYFAYIMEAYQKSYGTLYDSIEEYYEPPYDSLIPIYLAGDSTLPDFNDALPNNIYDFVEDSVLNAFYADTVNFSHPLRVALSKNDLHSWAPQRMTRLFYCGGDEQVFPENSEVAEDSLRAYGAADVEAIELDSSSDHQGCGGIAFLSAKQLFDSARTGCQASAIRKVKKRKESLEIRRIGPDRRKVHTPFSSSHYRIRTMRGRILKEGDGGDQNYRIDTKGLPNGVYILQVTDDEGGRKTLSERFLNR